MSGREISIAQLAAMTGRELGVSDWFEITQGMIDTFAEVTQDRQFIHVDPEKAKGSPFGGTIAHGFLTASMLPVLALDAVPRIAGRTMGVNYGFDRLRFVSPVKSGGRIRGRFVLKSLQSKMPQQHMITYAVTVEQEGADKPALSADWLTLAYTA